MPFLPRAPAENRKAYLGSGMTEHESELAMVQRHVREGKVAVERQRAVVADLQSSGSATELAVELLSQFEAIQAQHEAHLERLILRG